jgi:tetratricopeptide (TPR) repeat protein
MTLFNKSVGQEIENFSYYDSLTYKQYSEARWSELTSDARRAINLGYDYYYMRMRLGISLYERGNYLGAIANFRRALEFNQDDPVAIEYIYFCYLNSGKPLSAYAVAGIMSEAGRERSGRDQIPGNRISVDFLYSNAKSEDLINSFTNLSGYGETGNLLVPDYFTNAGVSFNHTISDRVTLSHAYTYLRRNSNLFYNDGTYFVDLYNQNLSQYQFYLSTTISSSKGMSVTSALHYLNVSYPLLSIQGGGINPRVIPYKVYDHNFLLSLMFVKTVGLVDIGFDATYSYLNSLSSLLTEASIIIRPLGNSNLYLGGSLGLKHNSINSPINDKLVYSGNFGFGIAKRVWVDFSGIYGDLSGYSDKSGFIVYNMANDFDYHLKVDISVPVGKSGASLYIGARNSSEYTLFTTEEGSVSNIFKDNYKSTSIIGGVSWIY